MPSVSTRNVLLILILVVVIPRLYAYHEPIEKDLALYSVISHELLEGRSLYSDLWEHKPPALFFTIILAQILGGYGQGSVFVLGIVSSALTLLGIYFAASAWRDRTTGLWAAGFWALISADVLLQADQVNVEAFMNVCFAWAFALMVRAPGGEAGRGRWLAVGALFAWASLYKHIAVFFAIGMAVAHLVCPPKGCSRRDALGQVLLMASVGFAAWVSIFGYYYFSGNFTAFWDTLFVFNQFYAGGMFQNLWIGLSPRLLFSESIWGVLPLIAVALLGIALCRWRPWTRTGVLFLAYIVSTFVMVAVPGKFYVHYYQFWLPVLAIAAAWTLAELRKSASINPKVLKWGGGLALLTLVMLQANYFRLTPEGWSQLKWRNRYLYMQNTADTIGYTLLPNEKFYIWGYDPGLYFYTQRSPVTGITNYTPLLYGPLKEKLSARVKAKLSNDMPELFVVTPIEGKDSALFQWIVGHYQPFQYPLRFLPYQFYYLKGGALEARLLKKAPHSSRKERPPK